MVSTSTTFGLSNRRLSRKSVSTRRNEEFDEKTVSSSGKKYFHGNNIFLKYWPPSNCSTDFQKNLNERISFPVNRKSGCNKGFV